MPEIITQKLSTAELQKLIPLIEQTRFSYKLDKFSDASSKEVLKSVQRARGEIAQKMARVSPTAKFTKERLEALSEELQHLTLAAQSQIVGGITKATEIAGKAAYTAQNNILSFGGLVPRFNPVTLSAAQLHSMVTKMPIGGRQLNEWVQRTFKTDIQEGIKSELLTGMLKGESYRDMTKRFGDKVFDGLSQDMETLTKSYVQSVNVQALDDVAKANKDIVKGWKWNSVCENRTCLACMSLDSRDEVYPLGEGPTMPLHPRCRCFKEIITKTFKEMGVDVDEIEKAYRPYTIRGTVDPITGKITPGKIGVGGGKVIETGRFLGTYEDFLKGQSVAVQRQILGPSRLELWKSGKVKLMDFADAKGNVHLLTELRGIETTKVAHLLGDITPGMPAKSADDILEHYKKSEKATFIEGKSAKELKADIAKRLSKKMDDAEIFKRTGKLKPIPRPRFVPAKTVKELNEKMQKMKLGQFEFDKRYSTKDALNIGNQVAEHMHDQFVRFPKLRKILDEQQLFTIEVIKERTLPSITGGAAGRYVRSSFRIELAGSTRKVHSLANFGKSNFAMNKDLFSITRHEFGHHIWMRVKTTKFKALWKDKGKDYFEKYVTKYSGKKSEEAFCEVLSGYLSPLYGKTKGKTFPKELVEAIEEALF